MAINLRQKLPQFGSELAGNYESALVYGRGDYDTPKDIRDSVKNLHRFN